MPSASLAAFITLAIFYEWSRMARLAGNGLAPGGFGYLPELFALVFAGALAAGLPAPSLIGLAAALCVALAILSAIRVGQPVGERRALPMRRCPAWRWPCCAATTRAGLIAILFLFAVVWATDIFAYFVGRAVGGPKLAPSISPGKTQSGALGGTRRGRCRRLWRSGWRRARPRSLAVRRRGCAAFGRVAGRRPVQILGEAAAWRKGFGLAHSGPRRRHGPRRRPCRGRVRSLPDRLGSRRRGHARAWAVFRDDVVRSRRSWPLISRFRSP